MSDARSRAAPTPGKAREAFWTILLALALTLLLARLAGFIFAFGQESLQMDFSAFHTAGRSVSAGVSPYVNQIDHRPPIWDGVNIYRHSRFLYPPLAARLFQPFAWLSYPAAKYVWMALTLLALGAALWIAARVAGVHRHTGTMLGLGLVAAAFHPVLTLLERGQIDAVTLLALVGVVTWLRGPRTSLAAGGLLALATLLKLHCAFLLPFLLLRKQWRAVAGFAAGGLLILLLGLALDGPGSLSGYVRDELPRIARHGEGGTRSMRLPQEMIRPAAQALSTGQTVMDGHRYRLEYFSFLLNASTVRTSVGRTTGRLLRGAGLDATRGHVALVFLTIFFLGAVAWQRWAGRPEQAGLAAPELVYWQIVLIVVLLCSPTTWVMNTVWLLPVGAIVAAELPRVGSRGGVLSLLACAWGLLLAGLPDQYGGTVIWPIGEGVLDSKYILAELLCMAGLLGLWATGTSRAAPPGAVSAPRRDRSAA